ncbi:hypothetical protein COW36_01515 [bacterium (Candidatus Blackallbacteria) CG17_big_fil_post_rev_8_21_14_2_50_48_46]|uniref:Uncharacterized protein n=1 Tax=bacterium (Candidatus Blackallbacteria) CG17_big_fil_post_rev_8_21_14_2_50_48_46 TaxID=2014261 RepID=A0A2M7GBI5_9BACT|nr:MAG: hypothetical protein COW36_01515 [bacterium (Candidatus Blackallbacteria) CG17_big_fil_post_rev_8_21_14_2_50_48_46]
MIGCSPGTPPSASSQSPAPTASSQASQAEENNFKRTAVAITATHQASANGVDSLSEYRLPKGVNLDQVKIVKANLDGREIDASEITLGSDADKNLNFFISQTVFDQTFTGSSVTESPSIHSSETFKQKKQELRTELLEKYQDQVKENIEEQIPTPEFLAVQVRGESLSRQKVAELKKDSAKLTKEGVFLDRSFYVILEVENQQFKVAQTTSQQWVTKLGISGEQVKKLATAIREKSSADEVLRLPAIAEKVAAQDKQFFSTVANLDEANQVIEIEEIEEDLETELGAELAPKGVPFYEFELPLDLRDLHRLEQAKPALAKPALADAQDDSQEDLQTRLKRAAQQAQLLEQDFQRIGRKPIPDQRLFDPRRRPPDRFAQQPLGLPPDHFQILPQHLPPPRPGEGPPAGALTSSSSPPPGAPLPGNSSMPPPEGTVLPRPDSTPPPTPGSSLPPPPDSSLPPPGSGPLPPPPGNSPLPPPP